VQSLDQVLDALDAHRQRATYGAIGALLGRPARSLMQGRPRDAKHSWVVRKADGQPTGYSPAECHPELATRRDVLASEAELRTWLGVRAASTPSPAS
jgi:hypothetical protein